MIRMPRILLGALALVLAMPVSCFAQDNSYAPPPDGSYAPPESAPQQAAFSPEQLDQLTAPVALYPDPLLSQVLMASTYPLEIVDASRWVQAQGNSPLQGNALASALMQQPWDPSVKSLVSVPQVLNMMDNNLQWTEQLGNAFLGQQDQVMDSVQHLRQMAQASGHLVSTPQETVADNEGAVEIQPADPQQMYVPYYNTTVVYGAWPYPGYAPYYFPPYPGAIYTTVDGIGFGFAIGLLPAYWGWNYWDWRDHRIDIDDRRFAAINRGQPPSGGTVWAFDPAHRHNVPYANPALRVQYQGSANREYRGFTSAPQAATPSAQGRGEASYNTGAERAVPVQQHGTTVTQPGVQPQSQRVTPQAQREGFAQARPVSVPRVQAAPAFESFARGPDVREQSQRGAYSRATPAAAPERMAEPVRAAAPVHAAVAPAPAHGGGENERNR